MLATPSHVEAVQPDRTDHYNMCMHNNMYVKTAASFTYFLRHRLPCSVRYGNDKYVSHTTVTLSTHHGIKVQSILMVLYHITSLVFAVKSVTLLDK